VIVANPFVVNRVALAVPVKRMTFTERRQFENAALDRRMRDSRMPVQSNYVMSQGQSVAAAEVNRKRILPGGPLTASKMPAALRNRYHPNATQLGDIGLLPFIPVGLKVGVPIVQQIVKALPAAIPIIGSSFKPRTPEQKAQTVAGVLMRFRLPTGVPPTRDQALALAREAVARTSDAALSNRLPVSITNPTPTYDNWQPSVSPNFYNNPAELSPLATMPGASVQFPAVDSSSSSAAASGLPSWVLPVGLAVGAFLLFSKR
jgi:hypothetical protein